MSYQDPTRKILADAKRANAKIDLTASCTACGESFTHKIPWFEKKDFTCPKCGGDIDLEPLRQMTKDALKVCRIAIQKKRESLGD